MAGVCNEEKGIIGNRSWYLPGGKLEKEETLEEGIKREMFEETGAEVDVERMICIADSHFRDPSALHVLFKLKMRGGQVGVQINSHDSVPITNVKFVALSKMTEYGFSKAFMEACQEDFINLPAYVGKDTFFDFAFLDKE